MFSAVKGKVPYLAQNSLIFAYIYPILGVSEVFQKVSNPPETRSPHRLLNFENFSKPPVYLAPKSNVKKFCILGEETFTVSRFFDFFVFHAHQPILGTRVTFFAISYFGNFIVGRQMG